MPILTCLKLILLIGDHHLSLDVRIKKLNVGSVKWGVYTVCFFLFFLLLPIIIKKPTPQSLLLSLVPGGSDGPSGVLICSENYITYKNFGDQPDIRCPIPRRRVSANYRNL